MVKTVEIYFRDLQPECQQEILREFETTEKEENWDVIPICTVNREIDDRKP